MYKIFLCCLIFLICGNLYSDTIAVAKLVQGEVWVSKNVNFQIGDDSSEQIESGYKVSEKDVILTGEF